MPRQEYCSLASLPVLQDFLDADVWAGCLACTDVVCRRSRSVAIFSADHTKSVKLCSIYNQGLLFEGVVFTCW